MKKLLLLLLLVCSMSAWAQDVIVKKDGSTIVCRVVEVNQTEVVYKRWSNLEGPNYVMNLADVSAINYENGEKVRPDAQAANTTTAVPFPKNNNETVSDEMLLKMADKTKPFDSVKAKQKAKKLKLAGLIGGGTLIIGGAIVLGGVASIMDHTWEHNVSLISGSVFMVCGATMTSACLIRAYNLNKKALYTVSTSPLYENEFKLKNGASLATGVDLLKDNKHNNSTLGLGLRYNF